MSCTRSPGLRAWRHSARSAASTCRCSRPSSRSARLSGASSPAPTSPASRVKLEASIGRTVAAVLASSVAEADELARLAVPKSAIRVIPCGIDTELFTPDGDRAERGTRPRLITFAPGGARPRGLESVVRALALLPEAELVIVGGPDARHMPRTGPFRELAQLATAVGVRSRVTFAGEVSAGSAARPAQVGRRHGQRVIVRARWHGGGSGHGLRHAGRRLGRRRPRGRRGRRRHRPARRARAPGDAGAPGADAAGAAGAAAGIRHRRR